MEYESVSNAIEDLQWAHATLIRLTSLVQLNALIGDRQRECVVQMSTAVVMLEGLVQEHLAEVRRRRDDSKGS